MASSKTSKSGSKSSSKPAPKKSAAKKPAAKPAPQKHAAHVFVDNVTRKHEDAAMEGHFVTIEKGEHQGVYGTYYQTLERGQDGYPTKILVRSRDANNILIPVAYKDVKHAEIRGGR